MEKPTINSKDKMAQREMVEVDKVALKTYIKYALCKCQGCVLVKRNKCDINCEIFQAESSLEKALNG